MDASALEARALHLERELGSMRQYAEERERDVFQAAEVGKALLRSNETLEQRLEEASKENAERVERLEQERFSLQQRLDCQKASTLALQQDIEALKTDLQKEYELKEQHMKQAHSKKVHEVELLCCDLRAEIERLETQDKAREEKVVSLEQKLREMSERLKQAGSYSDESNDMDIQNLYIQERSQREELEQLLVDSQSEVELLSMEVSSLQEKVETLREECGERSDQANQWYKELQASKEHVVELGAQLDNLRMELAGDNNGTSGNSLFGEVDDRRLKVERRYVSLQVKQEALEKSYTTVSQQHKRMKAQMSSLLWQFSTNGADTNHIRRVEVALRQSQAENGAILNKLHKLEERQASVLASQERLNFVASFGDKKEYTSLVEKQLSQCRKEHSVLTRDLATRDKQLLWESHKLREAEASLHHTEQKLAKWQEKVGIVRLQVQDLQEKLEQADLRCKQQEAQVRLLESELQNQRRRRPNAPNLVSGEPPALRTDTSNKERRTALPDMTSKSRDLEECAAEGERKKDAGSAGEGGRSVSRSGVASISFLEDLEKEFKKQRNESVKAEPLSAVRAGNRQHKTNQIKGAQKQNCPPLQPVIRSMVVDSNNPKQCPQQ